MGADDFTARELGDLLGRVVAALHDQRVSPTEVLGDELHEEVLQALGFDDDGPASALVRELRAFRRVAQAEIDAVLRGRDPDEAVLASGWTYPLGCSHERAAAEAVTFRGRFGAWPRATALSPEERRLANRINRMRQHQPDVLRAAGVPLQADRSDRARRANETRRLRRARRG